MDIESVSEMFRKSVNTTIGKDDVEIRKLIKYISSNKKTTIDDICNKFNITPDTARELIDNLEIDGYDVVLGDVSEKVSMMRDPIDYRYHKPDLWSGNPLKLGVISDTHLGISEEYSAMDELEETINRFKDKGVDTVLHAGDITHGVSSRHKDLLYEMRPGVVSADDQIDYIVNEYPQVDGIKTHFITGNHDLWVYKAVGLDVGRAISSQRDDLEYLGQEMADIFVGPSEQTRIRLHHPGGGSSYAVSYKPQKFIESMVGGTKPHLYLIGHYHRFCIIHPRNVIAIMLPGFMWNSPFYKRFGKEPEVGGVYLELDLCEDGSVNSFNIELMPYYRFQGLPANNT